MDRSDGPGEEFLIAERLWKAARRGDKGAFIALTVATLCDVESRAFAQQQAARRASHRKHKKEACRAPA